MDLGLRDRVSLKHALGKLRQKGALPLAADVLRGWPYLVDEAGRLWVFHPDVVG
jgi:hypothetical protein